MQYCSLNVYIDVLDPSVDTTENHLSPDLPQISLEEMLQDMTLHDIQK